MEVAMDKQKSLEFQTAKKERLAYCLFFLGQNILWGYAGYVETFLTDIGIAAATAALILRLDINNPAKLFTDETENILYGMKYEEFDKEVKKAMAGKTIDLKASVVKKCNPKNFVTDLQ
jgi:hypothetical protein